MSKLYFLRINVLFLVLYLFFPSCSLAQPSNKNLDLAGIEKYILTSKEKWNLPGLAIAIVKDGKVVFMKGYGVLEYGKPDSVNENTIFAIASNTKAFTSAALSVLVNDGKLSWDDKVTKYLPYFKLYNDYVTSEMTVRDLLCHRAGFVTFAGDLVWYGTKYNRKEVIERARYLKPSYSFRTHYGYSNIMFIAAGEIIPEITGKSWDSFLKEKFFEPLQMSRTTTTIKDFANFTNIAQPHFVEFNEKPEVIPYINWDNVAPAGSINSSVADMSKWIIMHLQDGVFDNKQILNPEQLWIMRSPQTIQEMGSWSVNVWPSKHFDSYGLGWSLWDYHGCKIVEHSGGADGMISQVVMVPEENLGFVVLTNSNNVLPAALMYYILDVYLAGKSPDWSSMYLNYMKNSGLKNKEDYDKEWSNRNKNAKPSLPLKNYCGTYRSDLYGDVVVELDKNKLVVKFEPTKIFIGDLTHFETNKFGIELRNIKSLPKGWVEFIVNPDNEVVEIKIDIPNPDFDFTELVLLKIK